MGIYMYLHFSGAVGWAFQSVALPEILQQVSISNGWVWKATYVDTYVCIYIQVVRSDINTTLQYGPNCSIMTECHSLLTTLSYQVLHILQ